MELRLGLGLKNSVYYNNKIIISHFNVSEIDVGINGQ